MAGICGNFGLVGASLSVLIPCTVLRAHGYERRHFRLFPGISGCFGVVGGNALSSMSVARASFTNKDKEDNLSFLPGFVAVSGSLEETCLSSVFHFCCPCSIDERSPFKHFAGLCGHIGFVGGSLSVFHFSCPCFIHDRRHFGYFAGITVPLHARY